MEHLRGPQQAIVVTAVLSAALACAPARAADPFGFYLGAGAGYSQVRSDWAFFGPNQAYIPELAPIFGRFSLSEGTTGWKLIAGVRPLSFVGAELEYVDFGYVSGGRSIAPTVGSAGIIAHASDHPRVATLFALGYVPLPLPSLAVFGKAGAALFNTSFQASAQALCPLNVPCTPILIPPYSASGTSTHFAFGGGLQANLSTVALRAEYERVSTGSGKPDQLSLAVTWSLL